MSHDKLKAAIRERIARTGEPYSVARRAVLNEHAAAEHGAGWFPISFDNSGLNWITRVGETLLGAGPGISGVEVDRDEVRVKMAFFTQRVPRASIRTARRTDTKLHGTSGVHCRAGRLLVNGAATGLVELLLDPPSRTPRTLSTMYLRETVRSVIVSLEDPDGFVAALGGEG